MRIRHERVVVPDYFATLDIGLLRGRVFTREELSSRSPVVPVVISEAMAERYWPGQDPVGHQFRLGDRRPDTPRSPISHEVIGVCRDVQSVRYMQDDGPFYYRPLDLQQTRPPYMLVRVSGDTRTPAAAIRDIVHDVDPQMAHRRHAGFHRRAAGRADEARDGVRIRRRHACTAARADRRVRGRVVLGQSARSRNRTSARRLARSVPTSSPSLCVPARRR